MRRSSREGQLLTIWKRLITEETRMAIPVSKITAARKSCSAKGQLRTAYRKGRQTNVPHCCCDIEQHQHEEEFEEVSGRVSEADHPAAMKAS